MSNKIARPKRPFRIGLVRPRSDEFKPLATIGVSSDGGIFLAPIKVPGVGGNYGTLWPGGYEGERDLTPAHVEVVPKLHYHQSGIASVTLTGHELERRRMSFPRLSEVNQAQVASLVSYRTWDLLTRPLRKGDFTIMTPRWPDSVAVSFSLLRSSGADLYQVGDDPTVGLIRGDDSRFAVDLSYFQQDVFMIAHVAVGDRDRVVQPRPSITVAAVSWQGNRPRENQASFVLYSDSTEHPGVWMDVNQPTADDLRRRMEKGEVFLGTQWEHQKRIFGA